MEKEKKKLHEKIWFRILMVLFISLCVSVVILTFYLFNGDVVSKVPKWFEQKYYVNTQKIEGRKVFTIKKDKESQIDTTIIYIHGGSYMAELQKEHWTFFENLLNDTNITLIVPDYPLTPKYNYKDVFDMMEPFYKEVIKNIKTEKFIVMGDSAGGGLALALMQEMGEQGFKMPDKLILISPWLDTTMQNPEISKVQENDPMLFEPTLKIAGEQYRNVKDNSKEYLANPLYGPMENLCPIVIYTGTYDILNPDVKILEKKMRDAGKQIEVKEYQGAIHDFILYYFTKENIYLGKEGYMDLLSEILQ